MTKKEEPKVTLTESEVKELVQAELQKEKEADKERAIKEKLSPHLARIKRNFNLIINSWNIYMDSGSIYSSAKKITKFIDEFGEVCNSLKQSDLPQGKKLRGINGILWDMCREMGLFTLLNSIYDGRYSNFESRFTRNRSILKPDSVLLDLDFGKKFDMEILPLLERDVLKFDLVSRRTYRFSPPIRNVMSQSSGRYE